MGTGESLCPFQKKPLCAFSKTLSMTEAVDGYYRPCAGIAEARILALKYDFFLSFVCEIKPRFQLFERKTDSKYNGNKLI